MPPIEVPATVLVLDDEEAVRRTIARQLARRGYTVRTAEGCAAADAQLAEGDIGLVLCDIDMPGESGLSFATRLAVSNPEIAVVMVTGLDDPSLAQAALDAGAYGYIIKPFEQNELIINVANALRRRTLEIDRRARTTRLEQLVEERTNELRQSHAELVQTHSLLAATLESTADGILVADHDGGFVSFNARFAEMWGLPGPAMTAEDRDAAMDAVIEQMRDPGAFAAGAEELRFHPEAESHDALALRDGRVFERSSKPQRVAGAVVGRVWTFHDITEHERLERELAEARDSALESSRLKSEFLATMSHEIRTPMNGVIGLTALLLDTDLTAVQREYADGVRASGDALLGIINDILDFSKIEACRLELEVVDFDLVQALDEVVALEAEPARARGLELTVSRAPDVPVWVRGDAGRLRQVLLNLVSNAVKFTPAGAVSVRASLRGEGTADQVRVHIEVVDSGIGFDRAITERLFEPFRQADASTTRRYGGTGLGLAICRRLVDAMGGSIGADSTPGQGSTFWVDLPFGRVASPVGPATPPAGDPVGPEASSSGGPRRRVLIVDDNPINKLVTSATVTKLGYASDGAGNGIEALEALGRGRYDLVLMDCQMPEMDGFEATAEIRRRESAPDHLPVIAMTASATVEDKERCRAAGMDDFLSKPLHRSELDRALRRWMQVPDGEAAR